MVTMDLDPYSSLQKLDPDKPVWDRFFTVAPLVLVGSLEEDGKPDLAPKHMAFPLGWDNYFGFVCAPRHRTYQNVKRTGVFTVSYPRPSDIVMTSLTASPRTGDRKPIVELLKTFPASHVEGVFVENSYLYLECELEQLVDGFGVNTLIAGKVVAAHVHLAALRASDQDDAELLLREPAFAYVSPGRFAVIDKTQAFPFPAGFQC